MTNINTKTERAILCGLSAACFAPGEDAKFGAAGLIMAILGGSVLPPLQALVIDQGVVMGMPAVNVSFFLPMLCFVIIALYGLRVHRKRI